MHALRQIHRCLRAEGMLLDVHPQPTNTRLEVWQEDGIALLGEIDGPDSIRDVRHARARLDLVERLGLFSTEDRRTFDLLQHFPSVDDWLERRASEGARSVIPEAMIDTTRRLLTAGGGELITREPIRASVLRRSPGTMM